MMISSIEGMGVGEGYFWRSVDEKEVIVLAKDLVKWVISRPWRGRKRGWRSLCPW